MEEWNEMNLERLLVRVEKAETENHLHVRGLAVITYSLFGLQAIEA